MFVRAEGLLEQVWDEQADPFTNTVAVTIGRLRRKLADLPVIRTSQASAARSWCLATNHTDQARELPLLDNGPRWERISRPLTRSL